MASANRPNASSLRALKLVAVGDLVVGLVLLIAGFAADVQLMWIVGAALVASAGTLFFLVRTMARQLGPARGAGPVPASSSRPDPVPGSSSAHDAFGRDRD